MSNLILDKYIEENSLNYKDFFLPNNKNIFFLNIINEDNFYNGCNIIDFSWQKNLNHPNYYCLTKKFPKKSAFKESYGENFINTYEKRSYWNEIEYDLSFYLKTLNIDYNKIIKYRYEAKIIAWNFFAYSMHSWFNFSNNKNLNISDNYYFDFLNLKSHEHEVDKLLIFLKKSHKMIHDYWEIFFEEGLLSNYSYWSYDYLKNIFNSSLSDTKIYYTSLY